MYENVVISSDGSNEAQHAGVIANELGLLSDATVHVMGVLDLSGVTIKGMQTLNETELNNLKSNYKDSYLDDVTKALNDLGANVADAQVEISTPAAGINDLADSVNADLIVIGRRGLGAVRRFFLGSVSLKVLELSNRPVLVVPECYSIPTTEFQPVVVAPTDFSKEASVGVEHAALLAKGMNAKLLLIHDTPQTAVIPDALIEELSQSQLTKDQVLQRIREFHADELEATAAEIRSEGIDVEVMVTSQSVADSVVNIANERHARLIVMSSRGRSGWARFLLGSYASAVIKQASVPVLVVNHEGS